MKKLSYMLSALLAAVGFSSAASADVSVSGSGSLTLSADGSNTETIIASGVTFALSSTTANGMTISTSGSISNASDADAGAAGGFTALDFATGGSTITVGKVEVPNGVGDVGPSASDMTKQGAGGIGSVDAYGINGTLEGAGVSIATAIGGGSLTIGYMYNGDTADAEDGDISGTATATGVSLSMPLGAMTVTAGYTTDGTDTEVGASAAMALGSGTLTVGYAQATVSVANETSMGASYAMSLDADTSVTIGYNSSKATNAAVTAGVALSRSLGGGASVFLEAVNYSGAGATDGTDIGIGTSFAF